MIESIFEALVAPSCVGGIFACALFAAEPVTKKYFSSSWHYRMWIFVLVSMIIPFKLTDGVASAGTVSMATNGYKTVADKVVLITKISENTVNGGIDIPILWICAAVAVFGVRLVRFGAVYMLIRKNAVPSGDVPVVGRKIRIMRSKAVSAPFVTGIFRPVLYLPEGNFDNICIHNVLAHESVHLKRCDIAVKWLSAIVKSIHWFNPTVYLICRKVGELCEISCDETAVSAMTEAEKFSYANTILEFAEEMRPNEEFTTAFGSGKRLMYKRLINIKSAGKRRKRRIPGAVFSVLFAGALMLTSGILAECVIVGDGGVFEVVNEKGTLPSVKQKDEDKEVHAEAEKTAGINMAKYEEVEEYETITESREDSGLLPSSAGEENPASEIPSTPAQDEETGIYEGSMKVYDFEEEMNMEKMQNVVSGGRAFDYNFDEKTVITAKVYPDEEGNIDIYFDSEFSAVNARVNISKAEQNGRGWGYMIPTDRQRAYCFCGFETGSEYEVEIISYCPGNYNIFGKVLIY